MAETPMLRIKRIGPLLRRLRDGGNLTQDALAWKAGVSRSYLQHLEHGRSLDVKVSTLGHLCDGLGISLLDFFRLLEHEPEVGEVPKGEDGPTGSV